MTSDTETIHENRDGSKAHRLSAAERARRLTLIRDGRLAGKTWGQLSQEIGRSECALRFLARKAGMSTAKANDVSLVSFLRACFVYDRTTGALIKRGGGRGQKRFLGSQRKNGYWSAAVHGRVYPLHHLVWAFHYGQLPTSDVLDHINRDPSDNRIENLRESNFKGNCCNSKLPRNNKSGFKGVRMRHNRWYAQILSDGKMHHLGVYTTPEEAARAYDAKARELHGESAATNEELGLFQRAAA